MGKGKPRHVPDKPQNQYGSRCQYAESANDGTLHCECNYGDTNVCKGNRHNCAKTIYHRAASRSEVQKIEDYK